MTPPSLDRATIGALLVVTILFLSPGAAVVAQTLTHQSSAGVTYLTNSGVEVTLADQRNIAANPFPNSQTFSSGNLTISGSNAKVTLTDKSFDGTPLTVRDIDATGGTVTIERTDLSREVTVTDGDADVLKVQDFGVDNGSTDVSYVSNNGLTIELDGLPSVGVAAVDTSTGDPLATDNVATGSSTATLQLPPGTKSFRLETTPSELEVRNEAQPTQLVTSNNVTLRARLFTGGDTVIERQVTNGTVSLDGIPSDKRVVITVREENTDFTYRRILIESVVQTSEIYILPTSNPSAEVRFQLADQTGRFDADSTRLFVEKPINRDFDGDGSNETRYKTISGDRVGADGEFPTILVDSNRYRIRVENTQGEARVLGSYVVQGASISRLPIGEVEFSENIEEGAALQASVREAPDGVSHEYEARIVYLDPEGSTESIEISVTNSSGQNIRPTSVEQLNGSTNAFVETLPLPAPFNPEEDSATVTVQASQGLETETFTQTLGAISQPFNGADIDDQVLELLGIVSIVGIAGLLVIIRPSTAALVTPGWAGLLSLTGIVSIPMAGVILAGVVGVLVTVGSRGGNP
jgi:hypothetical protein